MWLVDRFCNSDHLYWATTFNQRPFKVAPKKVVAVVKGVEHDFDKFVSQHLSGPGSSPAGSVGRDLNLQKLNYQYLTTIVAVVLVVRWYFNGLLVLFCVQCCVCRKRLSSPRCRSELIDSAWVVIVPGQKRIKKSIWICFFEQTI